MMIIIIIIIIIIMVRLFGQSDWLKRKTAITVIVHSPAAFISRWRWKGMSSWLHIHTWNSDIYLLRMRLFWGCFVDIDGRSICYLFWVWRLSFSFLVSRTHFRGWCVLFIYFRFYLQDFGNTYKQIWIWYNTLKYTWIRTIMYIENI